MKIFSCILILILLTFLLNSCTCDPVAPVYLTKSIEEDHSDIADPCSRWKAYNLKNYVIEQRIPSLIQEANEICKVYVWNNEIIDVRKKSDDKSIVGWVRQQYETIDGLFGLIGSINPDSVDAFAVEYDERFGFPNYIYIDFISGIADEELRITTGVLERLLN